MCVPVETIRHLNCAYFPVGLHSRQSKFSLCLVIDSFYGTSAPAIFRFKPFSLSAGDDPCLFPRRYLSTTRREVRDYTSYIHLSITNRAISTWTCGDPPSMLPQPQNVVHNLLLFSTPLTFDKFRCLGFWPKLLLCEKNLQMVQNGRVHFISCRSQPPVAYHFYLQFPAAGCVDFFSLRCFSLSLTLFLFQ